MKKDVIIKGETKPVNGGFTFYIEMEMPDGSMNRYDDPAVFQKVEDAEGALMMKFQQTTKIVKDFNKDIMLNDPKFN